MNIIYLKQAVKAKVNSSETSRAIKGIVNDVLGNGEVESVVIKTSEIEDAGAGCSILVATTSKSNKIMICTVGASTQDFTCVTDNNKEINEVVRSFEYVMFMSKKVANISSMDNILNDLKENKDLAEAIKTVATVATNARYKTLITGSHGEILGRNKENRYVGAVVTDLMTEERDRDIEVELAGRKGKLHLFQLVPLLEEELDVIKEFEDNAIADILAVSFIQNDKDIFTNRKKLFNFSDIINAHTVDRDKLEKAGIKFEKDKPLINTLEHVNTVLNLKSN